VRRVATNLAVLLLAVGGLVLPSRLVGQTPRQISGFWAGLAAGGGSAGFECTGCRESRTGPVGSLSVGRTVSSRLAVAAEVSGWWDRADSDTEHLGYLTVNAVVFPAARSGWHVTAGVGLARGGSQLDRGEEGALDRAVATGLGLSLGTGYDLHVGREVVLTPFVSYLHGTSSELKINGFATGEDVSHRVLRLGLGFYWNFTGAIVFPEPTKN
jgi:hypothetical protein